MLDGLEKQNVSSAGYHRLRSRDSKPSFSRLIFAAVVVASALGVYVSYRGEIASLRHIWSFETAEHRQYIPIDKLADQSRFNLNPNWDFEAEPTTREFEWTLSQVVSTPGSISKPMIAINDQSPGPTIEANVGDTIVVRITNNLPNVTTVHWHGQYQRGTPFYDGTFGITQCGISANGGKLTYRLIAQNVGTFWYHAHHSSQYSDGLYGALILHAKDEKARTVIPYDRESIIMLGDIYNTYSQDLMGRFLIPETGIDGKPGHEPAPDGGIINGISQARCAYTPSSTLNKKSLSLLTSYAENNTCNHDATLQYANLELQSGLTYRFRIINVGTYLAANFSIDGHPLTIVEADGTSVEPFKTDKIELAVGQRYSAIVTLDQLPGPYWIRSTLDAGVMDYAGPEFNDTTLAVLRYNGSHPLPYNSPTQALPTSFQDGGSFASIAALQALEPADKVEIPKATRHVLINLTMGWDDEKKNYLSFFNRTAWKPLKTTTTLFQAVDAQLRDPNRGQLMYTTDEVEVIELIVKNEDDDPHPLHLHGYKFWVTGQGDGDYTGQSLNEINPLYRDTVEVEGYGWIALRFVADNPGVWAFHCHVAWHMETGMLMQFESLPSEITKLRIPAEIRQTCRSQL